MLFPAVTILCSVTFAPMSNPSGEFARTTIAGTTGFSAASNKVEFSGCIRSSVRGKFVIEDASGRAWVDAQKISGWHDGDTVTIKALLRIYESGNSAIFAHDLKILRHGTETDTPSSVLLRDLPSGKHDFRPVVLEGTVIDVFLDELDARYSYIVLESDGTTAVLSAYYLSTEDVERMYDLIDSVIRIQGICIPNHAGYRRNLKRLIFIDPVLIRRVECSSHTVCHPRRQQLSGIVLATCGQNSFYLLTDNAEERIKVHCNARSRIPDVGDHVSVCGFVRNNIFFKSLSNSAVEILKSKAAVPEMPVTVNPREMLYDRHGNRMIQANHEGHPISISGKVLSVSDANTQEAHLTLDCNGIYVTVMIGMLQMPPSSSRIRASGICSFSTESDGNPYGFVRLTGFTLLTRRPEDIEILERPPWWTPVKLVIVIVALLTIIITVLIWNKALRTLAERRGRELMVEQLNRVSADMKVNERTRLAVELHDALSQNLTGVSLQLDAVKRFAEEDRIKMARHLDMAMRTLKSCRDELRNCLWDLRNRALEEKDMNEAIRRTASPFVGDAALVIRFNVPRDQISDNTAHALMRIIRELATNAVRHGVAKTIRIAGALENDRLLFSVSDDGRGFDPSDHPGVDEGHFGLDGIRERISRFEGTLEIESAPDRGATIRISMNA